ncbi:hypothetical protein SCUCBS95973_000513 [Sporothrix curviconia]|uniref:Metallo-beta-lactamase domain-containing protein n=1 Tax=Sporothrix curviconia TaxID=1260050 RepID=A0ABP0AQW6_9PEZI
MKLVDIPTGSVPVTVRLINPVSFGPAIIKRFMAPPVPGLDSWKSPSPSLSFLLEHPSGRKLVWDLGIRKDYANYAPSIASYIPTTGYQFSGLRNVADILEEHGVKTSDIEAVIWSHWHWDHIGDPSSFPPSVDLVVGRGFKEAMLPGAPANPASPIQESDYTGRTLREIAFAEGGEHTVKIGQLDAFDYFGDGSLFLLDTPGHAVGHLSALVRTTVDDADNVAAGKHTFVLLGGDVCHYTGILRPSAHLPVPREILPHPCCTARTVDASTISGAFCPGTAFDELQQDRGRAPTDTLYDLTFGLDVKLAAQTVGKLQEFDCDDNVFVIIAHDRFVRDVVPHFPASINEWHAKGWGQQVRWAFLGDLDAYWKSKGLI